MAKHRFCKYCKKDRQTTNFKDNPYVCEPCLRTKARQALIKLPEIIDKSKALGKAEIIEQNGGTVIFIR